MSLESGMRGGVKHPIRRMLVLVHDIPGRLRLRSDAAKRQPAQAVLLAARARALPGVLDASANPLTGSLVVRYDAALERRSELLRALGAESQLHWERTAPRAAPRFDPIIELLAEWLAKCLLRAAIAALM